MRLRVHQPRDFTSLEAEPGHPHLLAVIEPGVSTVSAIAPTAVFNVDTANFDSQVVQASQSTPVLVDFWADWCGPCKALASVLEKLANEAGGAFVLAKVDTDANQELAASMGIRSLPTVRLFVNGAPVGEFMGAQPESAVRAFLEQHLPRKVDSSAAEAIEALLAGGDLEAARTAIESLDEATRETPALQGLVARLWILEKTAGQRPPAELEAALDADSGDLEARFGVALHMAASCRYEDALDAMLAVVSRNRNFADGAARESMLKVFEILGSGDPRVGVYRGRLASALN
jgi:putative thioredoxin